MVTVPVYYGTGEGQTAKIAARIVETLAERGHDASTVDVDAFANDFAAFVEGRLGERIERNA